jgi:hypothetical protein
MSRKLRGRRPSPALIISIIALIAAVGGTAVALPGRNKVRSDDIKRGAVKESDIGANAVSAPKIKGGAVGRSDQSSDQRTLWAMVDGTSLDIRAQSGGISIESGSGGGGYFLDFGTSLAGRPVSANLRAGQLDGTIQIGICGDLDPGTFETEKVFCNSTGNNDTNHLRVDTLNSVGNATAKDFYVVIGPK